MLLDLGFAERNISKNILAGGVSALSNITKLTPGSLNLSALWADFMIV